jgi:hypothetical protein
MLSPQLRWYHAGMSSFLDSRSQTRSWLETLGFQLSNEISDFELFRGSAFATGTF